MSLDASTYTPSVEPVSRDDLIRLALESGWILHPVRDIFDPSRFSAVTGGTLNHGDYFYGWKTDDPDAAEYEQTLRAGQVEQLERWAQIDPKRQIGASFIYIIQYDHASLYGGDDGELTEQNGPEFVAALRLAKLEYLIELHANNDEFRLLLVRLIQKLRGGLWVDHLGGEWGTGAA